MATAKRIRVGFNLFAPVYDFFSYLFFGKSILHSQTFYLPELKKSKTTLIIGGGTGKLLVELMKSNVSEMYTYVDVSDKMIEKSKRRLKQSFPARMNEVHFVPGTIDNLTENEKFDLVITPYVLDCFNDKELSIFMHQLHERLSGNGEWLFADFNIPVEGWHRSWSAFRVRFLYFGFNLVCGLGVKRLPDFEEKFSELDMSKKHEHFFLKGFMVARIYSPKDEKKIA